LRFSDNDKNVVAFLCHQRKITALSDVTHIENAVLKIIR
jgi:hypothetical protein